MSRLGPNGKPQIAEFARPALMASTIMVELRKYMNSHFMVTEDEAAEGKATEGDSSATPTVYQRGPASLPQPPLPHNRALIHPMAKR